MFEWVVFGICVVIAGYLTVKITSWHERQFKRKIISMVLEDEELREEIKKLL